MFYLLKFMTFRLYSASSQTVQNHMQPITANHTGALNFDGDNPNTYSSDRGNIIDNSNSNKPEHKCACILPLNTCPRTPPKLSPNLANDVLTRFFSRAYHFFLLVDDFDDNREHQ